jgi:hypothetical protein
VSDPVTYTAVLPVAEETVLFVSRLLAAERRRRGTRGRRRALGCYRQAVLVLRWFCDGTRLAQLARDNAIGRSTAYRYLHEGIDALAAAAPGLRRRPSARDGGRHADPHRPGPYTWSDRPGRPLRPPGGPVVVGQARRPRRQRAGHRAPDGWPLWTSGVRPGREHDTTALRAHAEALPLLAAWTDTDHAALADLGYEGERAALTTPIKHRAGRRLTDDQRTVNLLHAATRGPAERGNSLLKTTFKALRRVSLCPWRIGAITAAALVLLHHQHGRTT